MPFELRYHPRIADDLKRLTPAVRARIGRAIAERLREAPERFSVPLTGSLRGHRKLRVGDYRVVFRIDREHVDVLAVAHRRDVYERAARRTSC